MIDYATAHPWLDLELWNHWKAYRAAMKAPVTDTVEHLALTHLEEVFPQPEQRHNRIEYAMVQGWRGLVWPEELQRARKKVAKAAAGTAKPHPESCVACGKGADGHSAGVGPTCPDCRGRIAAERHPKPRGFHV